MKHLILKSILLVATLSLLLTACGNSLSDQLQSRIDQTKEKITNAVTDEIKQNALDEIQSFFQDSNTNSKAFLDSVSEYLDQYELDENSLEHAKKEISNLVETLQQEGSTLSKDEIEKKLGEILKKDNS